MLQPILTNTIATRRPDYVPEIDGIPANVFDNLATDMATGKGCFENIPAVSNFDPLSSCLWVPVFDSQTETEIVAVIQVNINNLRKRERKRK